MKSINLLEFKYELLKFNDNLGLTLGLMAHTIISDINKQLEGGYE